MSLPFLVGTYRDKTDTIPGLMADLTSLPHLLVAGTTGSGKSVFVSSLLTDLVSSNSADELRLLLIDPKRVELALFKDLPHLIRPPITDMSEAYRSLLWLQGQMEYRFQLMERAEVRSIDEYNKRFEPHFPYIVVVIDELANLILANKDVEDPLVAIASMGRAAGVHLVAATQRPSADVLTGLLRANIPSRVAFATVTAMDSRIILDRTGAEQLPGRGSMIFRYGTSYKWLMGRYLSDDKIEEAIAPWTNPTMNPSLTTSLGRPSSVA